MGFQTAVISLQSVRDSPRRAARENHNFETHLAQFVSAQDGRFATFDHIGQQGNSVRKSIARHLHLFGRAQGLYKQCIDTARQIHFCAV